MRRAVASKCLSVCYLNKQANPVNQDFPLNEPTGRKHLLSPVSGAPMEVGGREASAQSCPLTCTRVSREKFIPLPSDTHTHTYTIIVV